MTEPAFETLEHPEHGTLAAKRLLDCVFALTPKGTIAHFHIEQMDVETRGGEVVYRLTARAAQPERARCQIIPPFVPAFKRRA